MIDNKIKQIGKFSASQDLRDEVLKKSSHFQKVNSKLPTHVKPNYKFNPYSGLTMNGDFGKVDHIDTWSANWPSKGQV